MEVLTHILHSMTFWNVLSIVHFIVKCFQKTLDHADYPKLKLSSGGMGVYMADPTDPPKPLCYYKPHAPSKSDFFERLFLNMTHRNHRTVSFDDVFNFVLMLNNFWGLFSLRFSNFNLDVRYDYEQFF